MTGADLHNVIIGLARSSNTLQNAECLLATSTHFSTTFPDNPSSSDSNNHSDKPLQCNSIQSNLFDNSSEHCKLISLLSYMLGVKILTNIRIRTCV